MARLALQGIHVAYDACPVLDGISLDVHAGELVVLLGPNGAGKSTLLRVAGGWQRPDAGTVTLDGAPFPGADRRAAARQLSMVAADEESVFPFTVRESVALGRHAWRGPFAAAGEADRQRVVDALAQTRLDAVALRTVPTLSAGERQRVRLARCLAQDAAVALFDEPTAHLDWRRAHEATALLRQWARDHGKAVLAVLHDLNLAARFADRVALLHAGRLTAVGTPAEVLTPERIEEAFGAPVDRFPHPRDGGPVLVPSEER